MLRLLVDPCGQPRDVRRAVHDALSDRPAVRAGQGTGPRSLRQFHEYAVLRQVWVGACCEIEAAGPSLTRSKFRDTDFDASFAGLKVLGGIDPAHPFPARHRSDVLPQLEDIGRVGQGSLEVMRYIGLWPVFGRFDVERHGIALTDCQRMPQLLVDL